LSGTCQAVTIVVEAGTSGGRSARGGRAHEVAASSDSTTIRSRTPEFYYYLPHEYRHDSPTFFQRAYRTGGSRAGGRTDKAAWDLTWADQFKGKHKQVFDLGSFDVSEDDPLRLPNNYLNAFRDVYQAEPPDVNVAVGIARTAFPINASDPLWEKFKLGELWKIKGPDKKTATRNIFLGSGEPGSNQAAMTVRGLTARGVVFWQCNIALRGIANQLARENGGSFERVRAELVAGLNPGVKLVPSHSMAVGVVQERGFTYMRP
jgi:intracellular sulfur oxidation DsrE/DsrF family protein